MAGTSSPQPASYGPGRPLPWTLPFWCVPCDLGPHPPLAARVAVVLCSLDPVLLSAAARLHSTLAWAEAPLPVSPAGSAACAEAALQAKPQHVDASPSDKVRCRCGGAGHHHQHKRIGVGPEPVLRHSLPPPSLPSGSTANGILSSHPTPVSPFYQQASAAGSQDLSQHKHAPRQAHASSCRLWQCRALARRAYCGAKCGRCLVGASCAFWLR